MLDLNELLSRRLIPAVVLADAAHAQSLGDALVAGGLPVAEVTFRTSAALDSIRILARRGDLLVGAGTVLRPDQVDAAADAGARFVVCPGLNLSVLERCRQRGLLMIPGAVTPTEIMGAIELGLSTLKFFPAANYGGAATLKALGAEADRVVAALGWGTQDK